MVTSCNAFGVRTLLALKITTSILSLFLKCVSNHAWFVLYGEARGIHKRFAWCSILKLRNPREATAVRTRHAKITG